MHGNKDFKTLQLWLSESPKYVSRSLRRLLQTDVTREMTLEYIERYFADDSFEGIDDNRDSSSD